MENSLGCMKGLRALAGVAMVSLINSVVSYIPFVHADFTTWISRGIMLAAACCMFQLASINVRYRKAGVFRAMMLACSLITSFFFGSFLLTMAASIFSILAVYQEYQAHSELTSDKNTKLSRNWHSLFYWEVAAALFLSFGSTIAAIILIMSGSQEGIGKISAIVITLLNIPVFVFDVVYLLYIRKTIDSFSKE